MKKIVKRSILAGMVLAGIVSTYTQPVWADSKIKEFVLDPMLVTATRTEKFDLDIPATTDVLTYEDIVASGASNVLEAVSKVTGIDYSTYLPGGGDQASMTNEVNIRGFSYGTLIMVNGSPLNLNNTYSIDAIPTESIERIEIIKGGGSVLYGSEAMAGVINIITKKNAVNKISMGFGNYGQETYNASVGNDKLKVNYNLKKWGHVNTARISSRTFTDLNSSDRENINIGYNFSDKLSLEYTRTDVDTHYSSINKKDGKLKSWTKASNEKDFWQLNYNDNDFKGHVWYNDNDLYYYGTKKPTLYKNYTYGLDLQKDIRFNDKSLLTVGGDYRKESYNPKYKNSEQGYGEKKRDIIGVFAQLDYNTSDADTVILGSRGTWSTNATNNQDYDNFSGSLQYVHKFDENNSGYASISQSFVMPSFKQMYPAGWLDTLPNPDLKPQEGVNYEIGYKGISDNASWKLALFHMDIKDNISAAYNEATDTYKYENQDFKNTGLEGSFKAYVSDRFDYNLGFIVQNPKLKWNTEDKQGWQNKFGKYQISGGVGYELDKFKARLTGSYIWARYSSPSSVNYSYKLKPYFLTTLTAAYAPSKNHEINLAVNNILDRRDILSYANQEGQGSVYTPCNFMLSYAYKF